MQDTLRPAIMLVLVVGLAGCGTPQASPGSPSQSAGTVVSSGGDTHLPIITGSENQTPGSVSSHGGPVKDHVSFVDHLRSQGIMVTIAGKIEQPFLRGTGTTLALSGGPLAQPAELQSFDYNDTDLGEDGLAVADRDIAELDPSGTPKTMMISWVAPPHFFRKERVVVLYLGSDQAVLDLLNTALGPQFAGK